MLLVCERACRRVGGPRMWNRARLQMQGWVGGREQAHCTSAGNSFNQVEQEPLVDQRRAGRVRCHAGR